jgi:hypothetical protein
VGGLESLEAPAAQGLAKIEARHANQDDLPALPGSAAMSSRPLLAMCHKPSAGAVVDF